MYSKLIHYGCSFTFGQDSGGTDIHDPKKTYPAYLGAMTKIPFVNKGDKGASLDHIAFKILGDLENKNSDIHEENTLVVVNLTSAFRVLSSVDNWWIVKIGDKDYKFCNANPVTSDRMTKELLAIKKRFLYEKDWVMFLSAFNLINSMYNQLTLHNKNFIFVDVLSNLNEIQEDFSLHEKIKEKCITIDGKGIVRYIADEGKKYHDCYSATQHYNSKGYKLMAKLVLKELKDKKIIV